MSKRKNLNRNKKGNLLRTMTIEGTYYNFVYLVKKGLPVESALKTAVNRSIQCWLNQCITTKLGKEIAKKERYYANKVLDLYSDYLSKKEQGLLSG